MSTDDIWRPILGFHKYDVSEYGDVRNWTTGRTLSPAWASYGLIVILRKNNHSFNKRVARLVYEAFYDVTLQRNQLIVYKDDNPFNTHIDNLDLRGTGVRRD